MNILSFLQLLRMIYGKKRLDLAKIQSMGLLAVKIGQVHALRIDFLPREKCFELSKLYRATIPIPSEDALMYVDKSVFRWIDERPLASASVGQVYRATLKDGSDVVIKVIKHHFKKEFERDVKSVKRLFRFIIFFYPKLSRVFDPIGILEHIEEYTLRELDLRNEIEGHETLQNIFLEYRDRYDLSFAAFPKIYKELSSEHIMVSEYIPGKTIDELLDKSLDYPILLRLFKTHGIFMFVAGTFHGDIHPGNLMLYQEKLYFVDTGAIGHASTKLRTGLLYFFDALSRYDYNLCAVRLNEMAEHALAGAEFDKFQQQFCAMYADFKGSTIRQVSLTQKMMDTIKLGVNAGMSFEKGMFSIIKSLMFLDGMVLRCNPNAKLMEDMQPLLHEIIGDKR
ncbi:MAG TPA: AarF/ABC1/UbiB kinase family protein [Bacteroidota bacterium]|nr:AarF/ABC1/UbiB kinase family protein [Bacteroidota bacterium]